MIINSDQESLLIVKDSKLLIRNLNEYNILKYKHFEGNRINLKIGEIEIKETFNEGIFNITVNDLKFQLHDNIELSKRILFKNEDLLLKYLRDQKKTEINNKFLITSLNRFFEKLKFLQDGIIINKIFKVDLNGQAYFLNNEIFKPLCIVAVNSDKIKMYDNIGLGDQEIDFKTLEILHKTLFLLDPNLNDSVFINQLPKEIKGILKKEEIKN